MRVRGSHFHQVRPQSKESKGEDTRKKGNKDVRKKIYTDYDVCSLILAFDWAPTTYFSLKCYVL